MQSQFIFHQLFEPQSSTYSYLLGDTKTREALLIDPVKEMMDRDLTLIKELGLELKLILETHIHADHITSAGELRKRTGAKVGLAAAANVDNVDLKIKDGEKIKLGSIELTAMATPGHTDTCITYLTEGMAFTGDALMIRLAGRTDFQQGSADRLYDSIQKIFKLPDDTKIFPGHDYRGISYSTVGLEKRLNSRIGGGKSKADFVKIMNGLNLPPPKRVDEAVPANLRLGIELTTVLSPQVVNDVPEIQAAELEKNLESGVLMIDVRRPEEFNNELGHIPGSRLVTLGPDLMEFFENEDKAREIVFICRSGARSAQATSLSRGFGFQHTMNLVGGMIRWNELNFPVERS